MTASSASSKRACGRTGRRARRARARAWSSSWREGLALQRGAGECMFHVSAGFWDSSSRGDPVGSDQRLTARRRKDARPRPSPAWRNVRKGERCRRGRGTASPGVTARPGRAVGQPPPPVPPREVLRCDELPGVVRMQEAQEVLRPGQRAVQPEHGHALRRVEDRAVMHAELQRQDLRAGGASVDGGESGAVGLGREVDPAVITRWCRRRREDRPVWPSGGLPARGALAFGWSPVAATDAGVHQDRPRVGRSLPLC